MWRQPYPGRRYVQPGNHRDPLFFPVLFSDTKGGGDITDPTTRVDALNRLSAVASGALPVEYQACPCQRVFSGS